MPRRARPRQFQIGGEETGCQMARLRIAVVTTIRYSPRSDLQIITPFRAPSNASAKRIPKPSSRYLLPRNVPLNYV